jgi:ribosomal protein L14E/L6E/L27E
MVRKVINFKQLAVTPLKIEIPRIAKKKVLSAAWKDAGESDRSSDGGDAFFPLSPPQKHTRRGSHTPKKQTNKTKTNSKPKQTSRASSRPAPGARSSPPAAPRPP